MKKIPCPISAERLKALYTEEKLTDEQIATALCSEGIDATKKRVARWREDCGVETLLRWERFTPPPIEGRLKSLLIGSMLGDGRIAFRGTSSNYEERHAPNQLEYLEWKVDHWGHWSAGDLTTADSHGFTSHIFRTKAHGMLNDYRDLFYENREQGWKILKPELVPLVDDFALAIWYLDDGCAGHHWPTISFGAKNGSRGIAYLIFEKFGLFPRWKKDGSKEEVGYFIFDGEYGEKFVELITPHVPSCMEYKLKFGFQGPRNAIKKKMTVEALTELVNAGGTYASMAKELGVGEGTIGRWLTKYNLRTNNA